MTALFKCLFIIDDKNYRILINNKLNSITFNDVLNELLKISSLENISLERHSFEIFDTDFNEYVLIRNGQQFIDNLSRIRVSLKPEYNRNTSQHIFGFSDDENSLEEVLIPRHETNDKFMTNDFQTIDNFESIISETRHDTNRALNETQSEQNTDNFYETLENLNSIQINGKQEVDKRIVDISSEENKTKQILKTSRQQNSFNSQQFISQPVIESYLNFELKLDLIFIEIIHKYGKYFNSCDNSLVWQTISYEMIKRGSIELTANTCQNRFIALIDQYFQILWSENDLQRALSSSPIFIKLNFVDIYYPFLYFSIDSTHKALSQFNSYLGKHLFGPNVRLNFGNRIQNNSQTIGIINNFDINTLLETSNNHETHPNISYSSTQPLVEKQKSKSKITEQLSQENSDKTVSENATQCKPNGGSVAQQSGSCGTSRMQRIMKFLKQRKENNETNTDQNESERNQNSNNFDESDRDVKSENEIVSETIDNSNQENSKDSEPQQTSRQDINFNKFGSDSHQRLIDNYLQQKRDSVLIDFVRTHSHYFENTDHSLIWQTISNLMIKYGFSEFDPKTCANRFIELNECYLHSIRTGCDVNKTSATYPLFSKMLNIDLSHPCLIKKIMTVHKFMRDLNYRLVFNSCFFPKPF